MLLKFLLPLCTCLTAPAPCDAAYAPRVDVARESTHNNNNYDPEKRGEREELKKEEVERLRDLGVPFVGPADSHPESDRTQTTTTSSGCARRRARRRFFEPMVMNRARGEA